ncbi:hypothetical protein LTR53_014768 [Teratosphaeriaceae sp. CCFEE 6253]|nr:hypothetical protein LTR53_014768 [Teratosphaeriaceae sp. CCFEE 6253]
MADKENVPPTPPSVSPIAIGLRPWQVSPFASPPLRAISPNSKPALSRQRDHSACGRPETPLKVRKTRENLRETRAYPELPPPCSHLLPHHGDSPTCYDSGTTESTLPSYHTQDVPPIARVPEPNADRAQVQRHKSVSRRMLSKVKQGINNRSKASLSTRPSGDTECSLVRRLSARRKQSSETQRRAQSFEISRDSITSMAEEVVGDIPGIEYGGQRSCTDSTVSTSELMVDPLSTQDFTIGLPLSISSEYQRARTPSPQNLDLLQPSPGLTPRPPRDPSHHHATQSTHRIVVPCVELVVTSDSAIVDAGAEQELWIAVDATVRGRVHCASSTDHSSSGPAAFDATVGDVDLGLPDGAIIGAITTLRLCYKPGRGCSVIDVVGQKALKDLRIGQACSLFIRVRVPRLDMERCATDPSQSSILAELESMVGTLESEVLHVEARYRSSLLPYHNVVSVRHVSSIKRPKAGSRWSIIDTYSDMEAAEQMHTKLAIYLADTYPRDKALKYIDRYLAREAEREPVRQIRRRVADELAADGDVVHAGDGDPDHDHQDESWPRVVVTAVDPVPTFTLAAPGEDHATAACLPLHGRESPRTSSTEIAPSAPRTKSRSASMFALSPHQSPLTSTTLASRSAVSITGADTTTGPPANDDARRLWQQIRRSSLSAKQVAAMAPEHVEYLEASDEALRELRRRALANKRSVGAETLKEWRWDGQARRNGEAPWL